MRAGMMNVCVAVLAALVAAGCGSASERTDSVVTLGAAGTPRREARDRADAGLGRRGPELARRGAPPPVAAPTPAGAPRPRIVQRPIPFSARRRQEMVGYAERHYGIRDYRLSEPKVIVEHYTSSADAASAIATFSADAPDSELHELPGTCAHFVIDRDGSIYQLVPLWIMCRHTVGLNWTAIGIEHAGFSDSDVLGNPRELAASLALTRWLRCRYGIPVQNVIGHNESLTSPYHREHVARLRTQTHGDWTKADMDVYRSRLARGGC